MKSTVKPNGKGRPWSLLGSRGTFPSGLDLFSFLLVSLAVALIVMPWPPGGRFQYRVGEVAREDVRAPVALKVEDKAATRALEERARDSVKPVFDLDLRWVSQVSDRISTLFSELRLSYDESNVDRDLKRFKEVLGINLPRGVVRTFRRYGYAPWVEDAITTLLFRLGEYWILSPKPPVDLYTLRRGFVVRDLSLSKEFESRGVEKIYLPSEVDGLIRRLVLEKLPYRMASLRKAVIVLLSRIARPNLYYNPRLTSERVKKALEAVKPVYIEVGKGEVIVRKGERITPRIALELDVARSRLERNPFLVFLGYFLSVLVALYVATLCWFRVYKGRAEPSVSYRIFLLALVFFLALTRLGFMVGDRLPLFLSWLKGVDSLELLPIAFPGVFVAFLFHFLPALIMTLVVVACAALMPGSNPWLLLTLLLASVVGAYTIRKGKGEKAVILGVTAAAVVYLLLVVGQWLYRGCPGNTAFLVDLGLVPLSALFSLLLVLAAVPLTELTFGVVTDIKLLSLINLEHPLMKDLLERAPGTYNHSVNVATLSEAAAQAVDANPLLAKAGAYYHDIGKLRNPEYFIENTEGVSRHDKLSPSMSRLVLISHVKDGVELAEEHRLPRAVRDIIQQHHGTSLIYYFYHKAKESSRETEVNEEDYRYPGPKPRTKEAAIVMMADSAEAATRALEEPSPARIKNLVREIITSIFLDGQLEECELTLRDIYRIMEVFSRILIGIYHKRVEYPGREKKNGNRLPRSAASQGA